MLDRDRQAHGVIVGVYPSPLVVRLADTSGFQWIARTITCEQLDAQQTDRVPAGRVPVDVPPTELRVGDQVLTGGRLVAITDLRYRYGATRTMILDNGRVAVAERAVRVYRPYPRT
ncbi:hypothetical protein [Streptomyces sp. NPDC058279]|uniref:hypothetical protein n=1 Tax=Streptomyces sp. NPDC058279 TaxID=3346418 RepID=UPI0036E8F9A2